MRVMVNNKSLDLAIIAISSLSFLHGLNKMYMIGEIDVLSKAISYMQYIVYLMLAFCILQGGYKIRELFVLIIFLVIGIVIMHKSGEALFLSAFLVIGAARRRNFYTICKGILIGNILSFIIILICYAIGLSDPDPFIKGEGRLDAISLGYIHPNVCGITIQTIFFLYTVTTKKKLTKMEIFIFSVAIIVNATLLDSRTTAVVLIMFPVLSYIFKHIYDNKNKKHLILSFILCIFPFLIFAIVLYTTTHFGKNSFITALDYLFNGRITLNNYNYYKLGVSIFGQKVVIYRDYILHNTIDCSYMVALLQCGIVGLGLMLSGYCFAIKKIIKNQEYILLSVTFLMLLVGLMENSLLDIVVGFPLIYLANVDIRNKDLKRYKENRAI